MGGFTDTRTDGATTPGRLTHIIFDIPEKICIQSAWSLDRELSAITEGTGSSNVRFIDGEGWTISPVHADVGAIHELGAPIDSPTVPTGYTQKPTWTQSNLIGITYQSGVAASGDLFFSRDLGAGDSVEDAKYNLASDKSSFPGPVSDTVANAQMNRIAVDTAIVGGELSFRWKAGGTGFDASDYLCCHTFNGPIGWAPNADNLQANGHYGLAFRGDGRVELYTLLYLNTDSSQIQWKKVKTMWYCYPGQAYNHVHQVLITPIDNLNLAMSGGSITFRFAASSGGDSKAPSGYSALLQLEKKNPEDFNAFVYKWVAPGVYSSPARAAYPKRVDSRCDVNVKHQPATATYGIDSGPSTGTLIDAYFSLPFYPDTSKPFTLAFWGDIPAETSITGQIFCSDTNSPPVDTPCGSASGTGGLFTPIASERYYYVKFVLTGNQQTSPILRGFRVYRDAVSAVVAPGQFEPAFAIEGQLRTSCITKLQVLGADNDPDKASASFTLYDLAGDLAILEDAGDTPFRIETETDPGDPSKRMVLFRGYLRTPDVQPLTAVNDPWKSGLLETGSAADFPNLKCYSCTAVGMWGRLKERLMPVRMNFGVGEQASDGTTMPFKVTDAIRTLFAFAGYTDDQLSIPDLQIRLFPTDDSGGLMLEPQTGIAEVIMRWAKEYLGGYVYAEPGYGVYGTWFILPQLQAPFDSVARFTSSGPADGKLPNAIGSYPDVGGIPETFIRKKSYHWSTKPPEGNYVIAYGAAEGGSPDSAAMLNVILYNNASFDFSGGSSPVTRLGNRDWLARPVPIYQYLPAYASSNQNDYSSPINYVAQRTFDVACHGRRVTTIEVPLIPVTDDLGFMRPPKFYDPIYIDGVQSLVRSSSPRYSKDDHQMMVLEIEAVIPGGPYVVAGTSGMSGVRKASQQLSLQAIGERHSVTRQYAIEKRSWGNTSEMMGLPARKINTLQPNTTATTSAARVWMLDYDEVV